MAKVQQDAIGRLVLSLRLGEVAVVETPSGDVTVECIRGGQNGGDQLGLRIIAPKRFNIRRDHSDVRG